MPDIITTHNLTKRFGSFTAVDHVNLHIPMGSVYGLIGRNGAGKTTIMRMLAALTKPSEGTIENGSNDPLDNMSFRVKSGMVFPVIGVLIDTPALYRNLSAFDNLEIKRLAIGYEGPVTSEKLLYDVGLSQWAKVRAGSFSYGMRQRLALALALTGDPDLLILDEPINGMDPAGIRDIRALIQKLNKQEGKTILISSHILEELAKTATHFGILNNGQLVRELTIAELAASSVGHMNLKLSDAAKAKEILSGMGFSSFQTKGEHLLIVNEQIERSEEVVSALVLQGVGVSGCEVVHESLEDYYMDVTGGGGQI